MYIVQHIRISFKVNVAHAPALFLFDKTTILKILSTEALYGIGVLYFITFIKIIEQ